MVILPLLLTKNERKVLVIFHWEVCTLIVYLKITDRSDMTSTVYRGHKAIMKHCQTEESMKTDIAVPPLILHWTYDIYLFAIVKRFFYFSRPFYE